MVKLFFWVSLIFTFIWVILLIYINYTDQPFLGIDKDKINSIISIFSLLITIGIGYFCWKYPYSQKEKESSNNNKNMQIGDNATNVIQINGNVKVKK